MIILNEQVCLAQSAFHMEGLLSATSDQTTSSSQCKKRAGEKCHSAAIAHLRELDHPLVY